MEHLRKYLARAALLRVIVSRPLPRWLLIIWFVITVFDTVIAQFTPRDIQDAIPNVYEVVSFILPGWRWEIWLMIGLASLCLVTLEFAYRQNRRYQSRDASAAVGAAPTPIPYEEWKGLDEIDLPTAAAIWSGTRDENDVTRHLRFRQLKQAVREGQLRPARTVGGKINRFTTVRPTELARFFQVKSVDEDVTTFIDFMTTGEILDSYNVIDLTDHGTNDFSVNFDKSFGSDRINCVPLGETPRDFVVVKATSSSVRLKFAGSEPTRISMKFEET